MASICTILARGGSKGLPGKNLRLLAGKPLIAYSVEAAVAYGFDEIAVSSDDQDIIDTAMDFGATVAIKRPAYLASDTAGKVPAIVHAVERVGRFDVVVDLSVTAPLRTVEDIRGAINALTTANVITVSYAKHSPYFSMVEVIDGRVIKCKPGEYLRRQDAPPCYALNGSIYVWRYDRLIAEPKVFYPDTVLYEMPEDRSVDIDTEFDFRIAEMLKH